MEAAAGDEGELRALALCFPDPVLRDVRLKRLADAFGIPLDLVATLTARVAALPPPLPSPDSLELADWVWERRRELFGR